MRKIVMRLSISLLLLLLPAAARADNWPAWRGPDGTGITREKGLPVVWDETRNVRWKVPLSGAGVSAPIVWQEQVILTASDGRLDDRLHVYSYHRDDGRLLWHRQLFGSALPEGKFAPGGMAVPTAATDGRRVYALFGTGDLVCLDMQGKPVWLRSLAQEYGPFRNRWGMAASPLLLGERLIVQVDHWSESYLLAVDVATGATRWRTVRDASVNWTSPVAAKVQGKTQIIASGTYQLKGYDADDGRELWTVKGMQMQCIPTPLVYGDLVYAVSGRDHYTLAIRLDGRTGDVTETNVAWKVKSGAAYVPSPICYEGRYYYVEDNGFGNCLDAATGAKVWRERMGGKQYSASPLAGDGKVWFVSQEGLMTVIEAGPDGKVLAKNDLGEPIVASPAIADGRIYLRGQKQLYCIEEKGKK